MIAFSWNIVVVVKPLWSAGQPVSQPASWWLASSQANNKKLVCESVKLSSTMNSLTPIFEVVLGVINSGTPQDRNQQGNR
jgi:hypothetical protein